MNKKQIQDIRIYSFFKGYRWDFKEYPDEEIAKYFSRKGKTFIDLTDVTNIPLANEIRDIYICIFANEEPYSYKSKCFPFLSELKDFMKSKGYQSLLAIDDTEKVTNEWIDYWDQKGKSYFHDLRPVIVKAIFTINELNDTRVGLDRNYWRIEDIHISEERFCKSGDIIPMNFWKISNETNRELTKQWFRYLLGGTELSYRTISGRYSIFIHFVEYVKDSSLFEITSDKILAFSQYKNYSPDLHNRLLNIIREFFDYMIVHEQFNGKNPINKTLYKKVITTRFENSVPEDVIFQLFHHIHELPDNLLLMFLINLFTGNRISDICQLTLDCIFKTEIGYFFGHDIQKMQNCGAIPISKELYNLIQKRIDYIRSLDYEETYLFPHENKKNYPFRSQCFRNRMKKYCAKWGITLPDGEEFDYVTHAFRHTISTELFKEGMPSSLIQLGILHHQSIDMSRCYIEIDAKMQKHLMNKHNLNVGSEESLKEISASDSPLPNGYCNMPMHLRCPNYNACLNCEFFRTTVKFLDIHKKHLEELENQINYYNENGFTHNLSFATKQKENLIAIIKTLEEIQEGDDLDGSITT